MSARLAGVPLMLLAALAPAAGAQQGAPAREPPGSLVLGPRLLDYPMECVDPRGCRIECFQHGVKVAARTGIGQQDDVRLVASGNGDDVVPRWIEVRPFSGTDVQTLLLTPGTFCDLKSLLVSPKPRP